MESSLKPRIVEIIRSAEGGMREHYLSLVKGLMDSGIQVIALCNFSQKDMETLKNWGVRVLRFPINSEIQPIKDIATIIDLVRILRKYRADLVHCHGFRAGLVGRMAAFLSGIHCLYTMHNFPSISLSKRTRAMACLLEKPLSHVTKKIIAVSGALKDEAVESMGIQEQKVEVIYNGIRRPVENKSEANIRQIWGIEDNQVIIGTVARLIPSKGIDILLEAIPLVNVEYPQTKFMILGDGPEKSNLKKQAQILNCSENIIFAGFKEYIWYYYDIFDIFVLPTLSEGLGISIIEALMVGLPVISTRTGGIEEIIDHNYNGYLVTPGNSEELARAIIYFLSYPEKAAEYARRGKDQVEGKFHEQTMIKETVNLIFDIVE